MSPQNLLVADHRAGRTHTVADGTVRPLGSAVLAGYTGFLTLPHRGEGISERAYADDRSHSLVHPDAGTGRSPRR